MIESADILLVCCVPEADLSMKTLVPYAVNWKISIGSARRLLHSASIFRFPLRYTFILIFLLFSFFKTSSPFLCFMGDIRWHALHPSNSFQDWGYTHKFFEQDCEGHIRCLWFLWTYYPVFTGLPECCFSVPVTEIPRSVAILVLKQKSSHGHIPSGHSVSIPQISQIDFWNVDEKSLEFRSLAWYNKPVIISTEWGIDYNSEKEINAGSTV